VPIRNRYGKQGKTGRHGVRAIRWEGAGCVDLWRLARGYPPGDRSGALLRGGRGGRRRGAGGAVPGGARAARGRALSRGRSRQTASGRRRREGHHTRHSTSLHPSRCVPTPGPGRPRVGESPGSRYGVPMVTVPVIMFRHRSRVSDRLPKKEAGDHMKSAGQSTENARCGSAKRLRPPARAPRLRR
jgi:hypothetical protein